eukprot:4613147-Amphidinium_carterae.1
MNNNSSNNSTGTDNNSNAKDNLENATIVVFLPVWRPSRSAQLCHQKTSQLEIPKTYQNPHNPKY